MGSLTVCLDCSDNGSFFEQALQLALRTAISKERKAFSQTTPSIEILAFFFISWILSQIKKYLLSLSQVLSLLLFTPLFALMPFSTFLLLLLFSYMLLFSLLFPLTLSLAPLLCLTHFTCPSPQSPEGCWLLRVCKDSIMSFSGSECWAYAVTAEQSVAITIQPATSPPGLCLSADSSASAMARPTQQQERSAASGKLVPYPW